MKLKTLTTLSALALMLAASPAFAQGIRVDLNSRATTTPARTNVEVRTQTQVEVERARTSDRNAGVRATTTEARIELQANVAKRKASNAARVMNAMADRLDGIIERLESRIAKVEAEGGVTAEASAHVEAAKDHLALARAEIAVFATVDLSVDTARENFQRVRSIAAEVKMHFRETHRSLMNAVRVLKGMSSARANATSTLEIEN